MAQKEQNETGASGGGGHFFLSFQNVLYPDRAAVNSLGFIFCSSLSLMRYNCHLARKGVSR